MGTNKIAEPDLKFIRELKKNGGDDLKKCYQCATCSVVCNRSPEDKPFPRKEMLMAQWGQTEKLMQDPDIWLCYQCNDCNARCPRGAKPGDVLAAIRLQIYKYYAFPSFMAKALATPKALPFLFIVPMILIFGLLFQSTDANFKFMNQEVEFAKFIPHLAIEIVFIGGNILIFFFVFISLWRYWRHLQLSFPGEKKLGFIPSAILAVKDILTHSNFRQCESNNRFVPHLLVFFGFMGAMVTAGLAVIALKVFDFHPPIPMSHPIKWLGNASGFAGIVGLSMLFYRRFKDKNQVGNYGYPDYLFLTILSLVFITGMVMQFVRVADVLIVPYYIYYVHLVLVFFLLWYAPYSKFAHMFYRSLALVYARSIGRQAKS